MSSPFLSGFLQGFVGHLLGTPDLEALQNTGNRKLKCSYCLNVYQELKTECPTCGAREFI